MTKKSHYYTAIALIALSGALPSCSDTKEESDIPAVAVYDFVTLEESGKTGSTFTLRKNADEPLIHYYTDIDFSSIKTIADGDRLILCYSRTGGETYTDGDIEIYGYVSLSSTRQNMATGTSEEFNDWKNRQMKVNSMWRTGQYINIDAQLSVYKARKPEKYLLVADKATVDAPYPELHVFYTNPEGNDGDNPFTVYASFDIDSVWSLPTCQGVKIYYPTVAGDKTETFEKTL